MKNRINPKAPWIFDGQPENVDIRIAATQASEGGYVLAMQLDNGVVRLAATRQPARYASSWSGNVRRYGVPRIVRMIVSRPFLRYEQIKRAIMKVMAEYRHKEDDSYNIDISVMTAKAAEVFDTAGQ